MIDNNGRALTENEVWNNDEIMAINADIGLSMHQLMLLVRAIEAARPVKPAFGPAVTLDFKQATEFLEMFGGEPAEICLIEAYGHSGDGIYAYYDDMPEEGTIYLGVSDDEAIPVKSSPVPIVAVEAPNVTNEMVSRFLSWKLPNDFYPDCHISFARELADKGTWPTGTNLLHCGQVKQMLAHVLAISRAPVQPDDRAAIVQPVPPEGYAIVPIEPTDEMLAAADAGDREYTLRNFGDIMTVTQGAEDHWAAMIRVATAAQPAQPTDIQIEHGLMALLQCSSAYLTDHVNPLFLNNCKEDVKRVYNAMTKS